MQLSKRINWFVLITPLLLFSLGFITLLSTIPELAKNQFLFLLIGIFLYAVFSVIDYRILGYFWKHIYISTVVLLVLTDVVGREILGSARWLQIGSFTVQPSEFAKVVVIIVVSHLLSSSSDTFKNYKIPLKVAALVLPIAILVFFQPDLGTSIVIFSILFGLYWYGGLKKIYFLLLVLLAGVFSSPVWGILKDYQKERILVFLNPKLDVLGSGYNVLQSTIAIGSGGLWGRGYGRGTQSHLLFLPVFWTDFIFAAFAEEWGFVGVVILLLLFSILLYSIVHISVNTKDTFGSLVCMGVFVVFFLQFIVNVGMNLSLMPVTGIPLPLVSYGGSSLLSSAILLGLVQSVYIHEKA